MKHLQYKGEVIAVIGVSIGEEHRRVIDRGNGGLISAGFLGHIFKTTKQLGLVVTYSLADRKFQFF